MMEPSSLRQRVVGSLIAPRQIMLLDYKGKNPPRNYSIRPISVLLFLLAVVIAGFAFGYNFDSGSSGRSLIPEHLQLKRQYEQLQSSYAESKAMNDLKDQELTSLRLEVQRQVDEISDQGERLRKLDNILDARKANGIHLINPELRWGDDNSLQYNLTLVKGGSYPRYKAGWVTFSAESPDHETVEIRIGKQEARLPFRVETHTFLRGQTEWPFDWRPTQIHAKIYDHRGKELLQTEIPVQGE